MSIAIKRNFTIPSISAIGASELYLTSSTASTSTISGALTVVGGVGVGGQLSINTIALGATADSYAPSMIFTGSAGSVITMSVFPDTTLSWEGDSGQLFSIDNNLSFGEIFSVSDISGLPIISALADQTITFNEFGGYTQVGSGLESTDTITGALRVIGGVGITGSLNLGSPLLIPSGGTGLTTYTAGDILYASSSTELGTISAGTAGSVLTSAGSGSTPYWAASTGSASGMTLNGLTPTTQYFATSVSGSGFTISSIGSTHTFYVGLAGNASTGLISSAGQTIFGLKTFASGVAITSGTAATSTSTGDLIVAGGVGIGGSLWTASTRFSSISGVGHSNSVITSGVWAGTAISAVNGGTGLTTFTTGDILYASSSTTLGKISAGTAGSVLTSAGAGSTPYWALTASTGLTTLNTLTASIQYFATSVSGSGVTIGSTGSTHTFYVALAGNASTGLISGAAQTIFGLKTFGSGVAITSGTASTSTSTGDLVVSGGVGIGGSLFTQTLTVGSGVTGLIIQKMVGGNYAAMYSTGVTPSGTNYTFITDGQSPNFNGTNGVYFNISNSNKVQITNTNINITPTTGATSTSTGSLTVAGGVGIGGSLWTATTNFSSISGVGFSNSVITSGVWSGTAISTVNGGTGLTSYSVGDILYASSSTALGKISAGTAGSVLTSAGAGTTPYWALAASTGVTSINGLTASSQTFATSISGSGFTIGSTGSTHTFYIGLAGNASTGLISGAAQTIFGVKTFASGLAITASTGSTSSSTGALIVTGGAGIGGTLTANNIVVSTLTVGVISDVLTASLGTTNTNPDQIIHSISASTYRTLKYVVSIASSTWYQGQEIIIVHDGSNVWMTEYAQVLTGGLGQTLSTFEADINSGNIRLLATPTYAVTDYKLSCTAIKV